MGFRFRKSVRVLGVRLNFGKNGLTSVSVGPRGFTANFSKRGVRRTIGIPGTGVSYSSFTSGARSPARRTSNRQALYSQTSVVVPAAEQTQAFVERLRAQARLRTTLGDGLWAGGCAAISLACMSSGAWFDSAVFAVIAVFPLSGVRNPLAERFAVFKYPKLFGFALLVALGATHGLLEQRDRSQRAAAPALQQQQHVDARNRLRQQFEAKKDNIAASLHVAVDAGDFETAVALAKPWESVATDPDFRKLLATARAALARKELAQPGVPVARQVQLLQSIARDSALTVHEQTLLSELQSYARP